MQGLSLRDIADMAKAHIVKHAAGFDLCSVRCTSMTCHDLHHICTAMTCMSVCSQPQNTSLQAMTNRYACTLSETD